MSLTIINLTPHAVVIEGVGTFEPCGNIARVATERQEVAPVGTIRVVKNTVGDVTNLPEPQDNHIYVVSGMVLAALKGSRADVYAPDTGEDAIRDEQGRIVAVRGLTQ